MLHWMRCSLQCQAMPGKRLTCSGSRASPEGSVPSRLLSDIRMTLSPVQATSIMLTEAGGWPC